jgi:hypothetical protein
MDVVWNIIAWLWKFGFVPGLAGAITVAVIHRIVVFLRVKRPLSQLLGGITEDRSCIIVFSSVEDSRKHPDELSFHIEKHDMRAYGENASGLITTIDDVVGFSYIRSLLLGSARLKSEWVQDKPSIRFRDEDWENNVISFGSPTSNGVTEKILAADTFYTFDEKDGESNRLIKSRLSQKSWESDANFDYALIEKNTSEDHTRIVLAGIGSLGTQAAAYYLFRNWRSLHKKFGDRDFGLVLEVKRAKGYVGAQEKESNKKPRT